MRSQILNSDQILENLRPCWHKINIQENAFAFLHKQFLMHIWINLLLGFVAMKFETQGSLSHHEVFYMRGTEMNLQIRCFVHG